MENNNLCSPGRNRQTFTWISWVGLCPSPKESLQILQSRMLGNPRESTPHLQHRGSSSSASVPPASRGPVGLLQRHWESQTLHRNHCHTVLSTGKTVRWMDILLLSQTYNPAKRLGVIIWKELLSGDWGGFRFGQLAPEHWPFTC